MMRSPAPHMASVLRALATLGDVWVPQGGSGVHLAPQRRHVQIGRDNRTCRGRAPMSGGTGASQSSSCGWTWAEAVGEGSVLGGCWGTFWGRKHRPGWLSQWRVGVDGRGQRPGEDSAWAAPGKGACVRGDARMCLPAARWPRIAGGGWGRARSSEGHPQRGHRGPPPGTSEVSGGHGGGGPGTGAALGKEALYHAFLSKPA